MSVTTLPALTHRDRSVLRAVAAGRCGRPGPSSLTVDGMALADQFAGLRLVRRRPDHQRRPAPSPSPPPARALLTAA